MRSLTFSVTREAISERPLRDLDKERGKFSAAIVIEMHFQDAAAIRDFRNYGNISKVFGQRLH